MNLKDDFLHCESRARFLRDLGVPQGVDTSGKYTGGKFSYSVRNKSGAVVQLLICSDTFCVVKFVGGIKPGTKHACSWAVTPTETVWAELRAELQWM